MSYRTSQPQAKSLRQSHAESLRAHLVVFTLVASAVAMRAIAISDTPNTENMTPVDEATPVHVESVP